jgi:hypothetical protein
MRKIRIFEHVSLDGVMSLGKHLPDSESSYVFSDFALTPASLLY